MAKFTLEIELDNAAFVGDSVAAPYEADPVRDEELGRILRHLATRVSLGVVEGVVSDINGNVVGSFGIEA